MRLAVKSSVTRVVRPREFRSDRLLKVILELCGRAKAVTFVVAYPSTETQNICNNIHSGRPTLDRAAVEEIPKHKQLIVLVDAIVRTGKMEKRVRRSKDIKIIGAYGRDNPNDNGELLLPFANNHSLALVNTFFSKLKGGV